MDPIPHPSSFTASLVQVGTASAATKSQSVAREVPFTRSTNTAAQSNSMQPSLSASSSASVTSSTSPSSSGYSSMGINDSPPRKPPTRQVGGSSSISSVAPHIEQKLHAGATRSSATAAAPSNTSVYTAGPKKAPVGLGLGGPSSPSRGGGGHPMHLGGRESQAAKQHHTDSRSNEISRHRASASLAHTSYYPSKGPSSKRSLSPISSASRHPAGRLGGHTSRESIYGRFQSRTLSGRMMSYLRHHSVSEIVLQILFLISVFVFVGALFGQGASSPPVQPEGGRVRPFDNIRPVVPQRANEELRAQLVRVQEEDESDERSGVVPDNTHARHLEYEEDTMNDHEHSPEDDLPVQGDELEEENTAAVPYEEELDDEEHYAAEQEQEDRQNEIERSTRDRPRINPESPAKGKDRAVGWTNDDDDDGAASANERQPSPSDETNIFEENLAMQKVKKPRVGGDEAQEIEKMARSNANSGRDASQTEVERRLLAERNREKQAIRERVENFRAKKDLEAELEAERRAQSYLEKEGGDDGQDGEEEEEDDDNEEADYDGEVDEQ